MKDEIQVTMMKKLNSAKSMRFSLLKVFRSSILVLLLALASINNHASANTSKNSTKIHSIDIYVHLEIGDDLKNIKISMPDTKLIRRADREINRNMANEIRDLKNFKLIQPESFNGDNDINAGFFAQYTLVNFYPINQLEDDQITSEFHAYNLNSNFNKYTLIADNELNIKFEESYKINPMLEFNSADDQINLNFYASNN